jgi:hypothetical protein
VKSNVCYISYAPEFATFLSVSAICSLPSQSSVPLWDHVKALAPVVVVVGVTHSIGGLPSIARAEACWRQVSNQNQSSLHNLMSILLAAYSVQNVDWALNLCYICYFVDSSQRFMMYDISCLSQLSS